MSWRTPRMPALGQVAAAQLVEIAMFKQIPMQFEKRQAGGVIGWTAAIAAYGPFAVAGIMGAVIGATGDAVAFFWGLAVFYALNLGLNWWYYARRDAPTPC